MPERLAYAVPEIAELIGISRSATQMRPPARCRRSSRPALIATLEALLTNFVDASGGAARAPMTRQTPSAGSEPAAALLEVRRRGSATMRIQSPTEREREAIRRLVPRLPTISASTEPRRRVSLFLASVGLVTRELLDEAFVLTGTVMTSRIANWYAFGISMQSRALTCSRTLVTSTRCSPGLLSMPQTCR